MALVAPLVLLTYRLGLPLLVGGIVLHVGLTAADGLQRTPAVGSAPGEPAIVSVLQTPERVLDEVQDAARGLLR
ncbi:hypothetical protein [Nocardioides sp. GY 10127]|uniref:hypothetical protein n=1 Tax=Nocardioides sp. GY 10127 TaxID=2569762 RepID=UPI0010A84030|nr:hypothetical protein [Nocardioides sp. GY 10127]TIC84305.1 hypothetical protein E8D37_05895 [Nocardioides sp. GY 10127]